MTSTADADGTGGLAAMQDRTAMIDGPSSGSAELDPRRWAVLAVVVIVQLMLVLDSTIVTIALPSRAASTSHLGRQSSMGNHGVPRRLWRPASAGGSHRRLRWPQADVHCRFDRLRHRLGLGWSGHRPGHALWSPALQGAFAALMAPAALSILTITFQADPKERAKAFAAYGAVSGAGGSIGVLAGGVLTQYASWRWCLLVNVPIALLAAVAAARFVRESRAGGTTGYDFPGAILSTGGLVSLVYGFTKAVTDGWISAPTLILIAVATVLLAAFAVVEYRSSHPLLPLRIVAERNRGGSYLATLLTGAGLLAMFVFLSYYFQEVLHYSALKAGLAFLPLGAGIILAAGASSSLVPRVGPRLPMTVGLSVGALGLAWQTQIGVHTSYWTHVLPPQILIGLGLGLAFPVFSSTALTRVAERDSGVASALVSTAQQVGGSLGTALLNTIAATATATYIAAHGPAFARAGVVHGFAVAFAVGAGLLALAAIVSTALFVTARTTDLSNVAISPAIADD